jgi:septal ring factor EnvC (AmiA/AmiB activator)
VAWTVYLDLLIIVLLVATIVFAAALDRRLTQIRQSTETLGTFMHTFRDATERAEKSVATLKTSCASLDKDLGKAETAIDDLRLLIDRSNSAADRLEADIAVTRKHAQLWRTAASEAQRETPPPESTAAAATGLSAESERAILRTLGVLR